MIRLQKHLAEQGICSRRHAEDLIQSGQVEVNGNIAKIGDKVDPSVDKVKVNGRLLKKAALVKVTLLLNKPRGILCSNYDPHYSQDQTVMGLLPAPYAKMHLYCAGRLDKESEGMVILTNDGELAHRLTHPSSGVVKRYHVTLHKEFKAELIPMLLKGIEYEGEHLYATKVIPATRGQDAAKRLEVHLEQGRKREIRRLFQAFGYYVTRLCRYRIGKLSLKTVPTGKVQLLGEKDIELCFKN